MRLTKDQLYKPYGANSGPTAVAAATTAANVSIADSGSLIDATTVEGALAELATEMAVIPSVTTHANADGAGGTNEPATNKVHNAAAVELADAGTLYAASDVEAGLAEAMTVHNAHKNADGAGGTSAPATNKSHNAAAVGIIDSATKFAAADVEAALLELYTTHADHLNADGAGGTNPPATNMVHNAAAIEIADTGGMFVSATVEGALAEAAQKVDLNKHISDWQIDEFPMRQSWYRNVRCDNTLSSSVGTQITIATVDTTNGTLSGVAYDGFITVNWLPFRPNIYAPDSGFEWAFLDLDHHNTSEPDRTGDYTLRCKIIGGVYADKKLYYKVDYGSEGDLTVGSPILIYNPHEQGNGWEWINNGNYIIGPGASGTWRDLYVVCNGIFRHSGGYFVMIVTGWKSGSPKTSSIGAFQSTDLLTWTVMNSDAAFAVPSVADSWRYAKFEGGAGVHYLEHEDRYFLIVGGKTAAGRNTIGWVKFDENLANVEYATDEVVTRTATYDHYYPSVVHYGGKWRLTYTVDEAPVDVYSWKYKEAFSNRPEGPYTSPTDMFSDLATMKTNNGLFCSSHFTAISPFTWRGRLYAFAYGCSKYNYSGNKGNLEAGLLYWNERLATPAWEIDPRSPILFNAMYASSTLWGATNFTWQNDHIGGWLQFYAWQNYLYLYHGGSAGTDSYKLCARKLQLT